MFRSLYSLSVLLFSLFSANTFAQEEFPHSLKATGRGLIDETTKETIVMACAGESLDTSEPDCSRLRLVQIKMGSSPVWLGSSFSVTDIPAMSEDLAKFYSARSVDNVFSFLNGNDTYAFSDQNGWNWSTNPLSLETKKFNKVVATVLYFAEYQRSREAEKQEVISNRIKNTHTLSCQPRGVFFAEVQEKKSSRTIVYSATENEIIFSLCHHGVLSEIKTLKITETMGKISIKGGHYNFEMTKALFETTAGMYEAFGEVGGEIAAGSFIVSFFGGIAAASAKVSSTLIWTSVGVACVGPWIIPAVPAIAGVATVGIDAIITGASKILSKDEIAKRKFKKLMKERNLKANSRVFQSMVDQIKAL